MRAEISSQANAEPRTESVVVIENDEALRNALAFMLTSEGYRVLAFADAGQALADDRLRTASCLIVDDALSDLGGLELVERLRGRGVMAPSFLVVSLPSERRRRAALDAGVALLDKPLNGDDLRDRVHAVLGLSPT